MNLTIQTFMDIINEDDDEKYDDWFNKIGHKYVGRESEIEQAFVKRKEELLFRRLQDEIWEKNKGKKKKEKIKE